MVSQALLKQVPIPRQNVHRLSTELASPERVAGQYEATLQEYLYVFDPTSSRKQCPVFDLILLGMGPDGHTASLFPDSPVLNEQEHWVAATPVPKLQPAVQRITFTFPVINAAKTVAFLVSGEKKRSIMQAILDNPEQAREHYPSARVDPDGKLVWFVL
jgi:6-phosphogluconolactonase